MSTAETTLSDRLASYRTLRAGITPGPWTADLREPWDMVIWGAHGTNPEPDNPQNPKLVMNIGESIARVGDVCGSEADARFIASAPQIADDCLALAEENARLREALERAEYEAIQQAAGVVDWQRETQIARGEADHLEQRLVDATEEKARLQAELARLEAIIAAWNGFADDLGTGILEALTPDAARLSSDGARHE